MYKIAVVVEEVEQADEIQALLEEAAEDGRLDFAFEVKQSEE